MHRRVTGHQIYLSTLAGYTSSHEQYFIYAQRTTKLSMPMIESFVTLKVLIQNERTWWFTAWTLCSAFAQGIVRVGYSPSLLLLWILVCMKVYNSWWESCDKYSTWRKHLASPHAIPVTQLSPCAVYFIQTDSSALSYTYSYVATDLYLNYN